ncbi:hypothetical protein CKM354_000721100 [Cercospora kikuchii]|uniref:Rhodopsin domain-containing protein n=1 Tax=Cercospora kikuchii TaxID=84275 RepID=A0A9P3CMB4_9PEZI|nr:uncharacterized protein CKM354_000721100 [Cercospora kikuchii]GIZ44002.1 hypothetical protein CKM354_000721100 [Cercospora kikuchii]
MGSTQVYHDQPYLIEVWVLFGVGVLVFLARFIVRIRTVGIRQFAGDDYMAILVLACYTADAATVSVVVVFRHREGTNVDYTAEQVEKLTPSQIKSVEYGSKMQLLAWFTYTALSKWGLKACMLFFFHRITFGLPQERYVKALGVACGLTYLAMFLTIMLSCRPLRLNWQVRPKPPDHCEVRIQNFYVCTVLNVITDAALLAVPIPLLWKLKIPLRKKITIGLLLSSGIFVITAALTRIVMTLKANPSATVINRWGVRETIAGIIAVNAPILQPMCKKSFYRKGFRTSNGSSNPVQPQTDEGGSGSRDKSSGIKSNADSTLSKSAHKPAATELSPAVGPKVNKRTTIALPPAVLSRPPAVMTPIAAELREIERIDTRLDETPRREIITGQDHSFENGDYFGVIDIEHGARPSPPDPIEIIEGERYRVASIFPPAIELEPPPPPISRRWSESVRVSRLSTQWRHLTRSVSLPWTEQQSREHSGQQ